MSESEKESKRRKKRGIQPFYHSPIHSDTHTLTHSLNLCAMSKPLQVYKTQMIQETHFFFFQCDRTIALTPQQLPYPISLSLLLSLLSITCRYLYVQGYSLAPAQMEMDSGYAKPTTRGCEMTMVLVTFCEF